MKSPIPTPKFDIAMDGGIYVPPRYKIIENLGFESDFVSYHKQKSFLHKKKFTKIHKHKIQEGLTMVFYDYKEQIDFIQDGEVLYTTPGDWHCHFKKNIILREISLSKLI